MAINATPAGQHKDENQVTQATAKDHAQHHNEDQLRERHEHLGQTKHDLIEDAALIAAVAAQQHADDCRDQCRAETDQHGQAPAVQGAGKYVASQLVCAENVLQRWRLIDGTQIRCNGIIGRDQRRKEAGQKDTAKNHKADHSQTVLEHFLHRPAHFAFPDAAFFFRFQYPIKLTVILGTLSLHCFSCSHNILP